jgi:phospholipid/cholesterol/gamma-HCH transport system substrate-binding protein
METKANYTIVGLFTVLVLAAAFGFVYWMSNYGNQGDIAPLNVRIPGSANGLSVGSAVRFNGIAVGTVRGLTIDQSDPNFVIARTDVRADAPVTANTRAVLEIQGLTGSAYIELSAAEQHGGDNILQEALQTGQPAVLVADPSSVTNLLATADQILQRANNVVGEIEGFVLDAREPLTETLRNTSEFSQALADNADGIDQFLQSVASLSDTFSSLSGRLDSTFAAAEEILTAVDPEKIDSILTNVDTISSELTTASREVTTTVQSFRATAQSFRDFSETAGTSIESLDSILANVDGIVANIDAADVDQAMNDITAAAASARQAIANTEQITRQFGERTDDIDQFITDVTQMAERLNAASVRVDGVLAKVDGFLGEGDASNLLAEAEAAIQSFRQVADTVNARVGPIADNLERFSNSGLRDVEALISETRRSISRIERSISSIEQNPQRLIFGGEEVREFDGRVRR